MSKNPSLETMECFKADNLGGFICTWYDQQMGMWCIAGIPYTSEKGKRLLAEWETHEKTT